MWIWTIFLLLPLSFAKNKLHLPDGDEFAAVLAQHRTEALPTDFVGDEDKVVYAPISALISGQPTFSYLKVRDNLSEAYELYGLKYRDKEFRRQYDKGRSLYPLDRKIKGILFRGHVYVIDGHHKILTSMYTRASTVPVHIVNVWAAPKWRGIKSKKDFHRRMVEMGFAYEFDKKGKAVNHFWTFSEVEDEPNLYLARLIIHKLKLALQFSRLDLVGHSGARFPVILKVNEDIPFLEFYIANILRLNGIYYNPDWGNEIPNSQLSKIREVIGQARYSRQANLRKMIYVADPNLDLKHLDDDVDVRRRVLNLLFSHFRKQFLCEDILSDEFSLEVEPRLVK